MLERFENIQRKSLRQSVEQPRRIHVAGSGCVHGSYRVDRNLMQFTAATNQRSSIVHRNHGNLAEFGSVARIDKTGKGFFNGGTQTGGADVAEAFVEGVTDGADFLKAQSARLISANNTRSVVELVLAEGKNREVRRLFASAGLKVLRLQRLQIGPIKLGELPAGKWRTLTESEIKSLLPKI